MTVHELLSEESKFHSTSRVLYNDPTRSGSITKILCYLSPYPLWERVTFDVDTLHLHFSNYLTNFTIKCVFVQKMQSNICFHLVQHALSFSFVSTYF